MSSCYQYSWHKIFAWNKSLLGMMSYFKWPMISSHSRIHWDYQLCFSSNSWKAEIVDWTNSNNLVFFFLLLLLFTSACGLFATWRRGSTFPLGGHLQQTHEKDDWLGRAWREFMSKKKIYKTTQRKSKYTTLVVYYNWIKAARKFTFPRADLSLWEFSKMGKSIVLEHLFFW